MKIFASDRLFEEAARSPESCDKLLKKLRRARMFSLIAGLALGLIPIALGIPLIVGLMRFLNSPFTVSPPTLAGHSVSAAMIWAAALPLLVGIITQIIFMMHCDACIKMLLFVRGQQNSSSQ